MKLLTKDEYTLLDIQGVGWTKKLSTTQKLARLKLIDIVEIKGTESHEIVKYVVTELGYEKAQLSMHSKKDIRH